MNFTYETDRLILKVLQPVHAQMVLDFVSDNAEVFSSFEPVVAENYYTVEHQEAILEYEYNHFLKLEMIRYYVFLKDEPDKIIGTVSFRNIQKPVYSTCTLGYKIHRDYWHNGLCYEAIDKLIDELTLELGIHRIEAYVMPDNFPSIGLLEKLGFEKEGLLRDKISIKGAWEDHYIYSLITEA